MAQLVASQVTYSMVEGSRMANAANPMSSAIFTISFGDGTATYTNGGVPLTKAKLGCPESVQELYFLDTANGGGYSFSWNRTSNTVQMFQAPAQSHAHNYIMKGGVTTTADFLYHSSGALGFAATPDVTMTASAIATKGGVVSASLVAAALAEVATSATVTGIVLRVRVVGW